MYARCPRFVFTLFASLALLSSAVAQQVLPRPDPQFNGKIGRTAKESTPDFPKEVRAPKGAPNILLIMTDDVGFAASSPFGGPIPTPTLDGLARSGLRYNQFHTTALCSPTRAALITGRNHHTAATGMIMEMGTGYPGYNTLMPKSVGTIAEVLKQNGYSTAWFGKNHNVPDWQTSAAGPFDLWPTGLGFDYFYGFLGGDTDQWHPAVFENTRPIEPPEQHGDKPNALRPRSWPIRQSHWIRMQQAWRPTGRSSPTTRRAQRTRRITRRRIGSPNSRASSTRAGTSVREETFARQKKLGVIPARCEADAASEGSSRVGLAVRGPEAALRPNDGGLRRGAGPCRPPDRPRDRCDRRNRANSTTRSSSSSQGDNGASAEGTLQGTTNEVGTAGNGVAEDFHVPAVDDRRARRSADLQPLSGRLGARDGHAVPVDASRSHHTSAAPATAW